jgi:ubiquinone/menaquinone biosynthesis C-methylase UbiE
MKQKDIFLSSEGDAWFDRNHTLVAQRHLPEDDPILVEVLELPPIAKGITALEIGCGDGTRLEWLKDNLGAKCFGIDPSSKGVARANQRGVHAQRGTADRLPFENDQFDLVIFGFCLYLCDRDDLFQIAQEAHRVLKTPGWLVILDFYSPVPVSRAFHHRTGVFSYKMDYRSLFTWHPAYECVTHKVRHHENKAYTDDIQEWVAVSVLRKNYVSEEA